MGEAARVSPTASRKRWQKSPEKVVSESCKKGSGRARIDGGAAYRPKNKQDPRTGRLSKALEGKSRHNIVSKAKTEVKERDRLPTQPGEKEDH